MQNYELLSTEPEQQNQRKQIGCGTLAVYALASLWMVASTVVAAGLFWLVDEIHFEGLPSGGVLSRFAIMAAYAVIALIPIGILARQWKEPIFRTIFSTWAVALIFALVLSPVRLAGVTASDTASVLQIALIAVFLLGEWFWLRHREGVNVGKILKPASRGLGLALLITGLLALPWAAYGALGSPLDIFLTILSGLLFGVAAAWVLEFNMLFPIRKLTSQPGNGYGLVGLSAVIALLAMLAGMIYTGFQWYLVFAVPMLGWIMTGLDWASTREEGSPNWLPGAVLIGLGTILPMLFVDPDELSMVISAGPGELLQWVQDAGMITLAIELVLGIIFYLFRQRLFSFQTKPIWIGAAAAAWIAMAMVYFVIGQPGFYGERIFVVLKDQADLSAAPKMTDYAQRRIYVYHTLVNKAEQSQTRLRDIFTRFGIEYKPYYLENSIEVQGGPLLKAWLLTQPEVDRVLSNPILRPLPEPVPVSRGNQPAPQEPQWNLTSIGAERVWSELNVTGKGIVVGQSDSGVQGDHPELAASYRGQSTGSNYNWYDPWNGTTKPTDIGGHGTHTLGSIVGKTTGVAPGATWFGCVNLARNLGNPAYYLDCMQYMLAPFPQSGDPLKDGDPTRSANVINNSWGCPDVEGCDANALLPAVNALRSAGIFVVASAGNNGEIGCGSVKDPLAIYAAAFSVGAIDASGQLASFSSVGPVTIDGSDRVKPDIVAPGVDVLSAFPGSTYAIESGTSMAGPHVVGVVALMWSANPKLIGNIEKTQEILEKTAKPYTGNMPACANSDKVPNDGAGWGVVDAYSAVKMAMQP